MNPIITQKDIEDIEQPRTQQELWAWAHSIREKWSFSGGSKKAFRLNQEPFVKKLREEFWPLALFARAFYRDRSDVLFAFAVGNQSYDARILDACNCSVTSYLQITQSFDGLQDHCQMIHLNKYGHASLTATYSPPGKKCTIPEVQQYTAIDHDDAINKTCDRILCAIKRKSKNFSYEKNTSLIVKFENHFIDTDTDWDVIRQFSESELPAVAAGKFDNLYLVSEKKCFHIPLPGHS